MDGTMDSGFENKPVQIAERFDLQALFLSQFIDQANVGMFVIRDGVFFAVNQHCAHQFGYSVDELRGQETVLIFSSSARQTMLDFFSILQEGEYHHIHYTLQGVHKSGRLIHCEILGLAYLEAGQRVTMAICNNLDENRFTEAQARTAFAIFDSAQEGILITDTDACILMVNPAFTHITGYDQAELVGQNPRILKSDKQTLSFYEEMWHQLTTVGSWHGELWNKKKNGHEYKESLSINAIKNEQGELTGYVSICSDLTERMDLQAELSFQTAHDPLTGLPNRETFKMEVNQLVKRANPEDPHFAVVQVDVDRFQNLNNTLGHYTGDQILSRVAARIQGCLTKDETAARYGGDIFSLLLIVPDSLANLNTRLLQILESIHQPIELNERSIIVTASMGVAVHPEDGTDENTLLQNADVALADAKTLGGDRYSLHDPEMNERTQRWFLLSNELRTAEKEKQFYMEYQPQVDLHTGRVTGVEALARWNHPKLGVVPPDEFIPILEEIGLSGYLTEFVLDETCRVMKENRWDTIPGFRLAINLSLRQLKQPDLLTRLSEIDQRYQVSRNNLEIEITESTAMSSPQTFQTLFEKIKALGFSIAIDDFGTGHSSLAYLSLFPIDKIKIDKSFISSLPETHEKQAIVHAILSLAESLGVTVVAEGVETALQAEYLRQTYCQQYQGYYASKPVTPEKLKMHYSV